MMARRQSKTRGRTRQLQQGVQVRRWRWLGAVALVLMVGGAFVWWNQRHWVPERRIWPVQGALVGSDDGELDFVALKAIGANFVYVEAAAGAVARDPGVVRNLDAGRAAGLRVGAVHKYDPCQPADKQAANFVTVIPRDPKLLPPAVELERVARDCLVPVNDAAVVSELMTFLNQIETHTGKPAILKLGAGFEARYHIAGAIDRRLWLSRDRFSPDYAGRPWDMWTANSALSTSAGDAPLRWVVVQK
jgi:lysozyme